MPEAPTETPKRHKRYSAQFKGEALALLKANKNNVLATAEQLNIPRLTLREWAVNQRGITTEVREFQQEKETDLALRYRTAAGAYLEHALDPLTIRSSTGLEAMKASGIATDKSQLLLGQPTAIHGSVMSEDERRLKVAELLARIADRRSAAQAQAQAETSTILPG
jgi:transposase-like protein